MTSVLASPAPAIALAVLGAVCFAGAAVLQHRAVVAVGSEDRREGAPLSLRGLRALARRPGWLAGLALAVGGTTLHAIALVLAPLTVVQPIGVLAVPIAVLLTSLRNDRHPGRGAVLGVALTVVAVGAFVLTAAGTAVSTPAPDGATAVAGLVVAGLVVLVGGLGLAQGGWVRCVTCATAGAIAFGLVSALVRAVSQSVRAREVALLDPPVLAALAGAAAAVLVGGWLVQQAFDSGPPEVVVACLTVVDPIVAVVLGVVLLGEGNATPASTWMLLIGCALAATAGVVALARYHPDVTSRAAARRAAAHDPAPQSTHVPHHR